MYARDEREVSVRLATERRELFAILLFFVGAFYPFFFFRKTSRERDLRFLKKVQHDERKNVDDTMPMRVVCLRF